MVTGYTDVPYNMGEIAQYVVTDEDRIVSEIIGAARCYFYDTCSLRRHACLDSSAEYILRYIKGQRAVVVITRCILMELASHSGVLNPEYIDYIRRISDYGITVLVVYEESLFSVMEVCFGANATINGYLCWAVRTTVGPVSSIKDMLRANPRVNREVVCGKGLDSSGVYSRFFQAARGVKESGDNLGEDLLAICLQVLSHIPGEPDGKFCMIADDKGAAAKMDRIFKKVKHAHRGRRIGVFSTPRLAQTLYREGVLHDRESLCAILGAGTNGNLSVLGVQQYDIDSAEITLTKDELADLIMQPDGIAIIF